MTLIRPLSTMIQSRAPSRQKPLMRIINHGIGMQSFGERNWRSYLALELILALGKDYQPPPFRVLFLSLLPTILTRFCVCFDFLTSSSFFVLFGLTFSVYFCFIFLAGRNGKKSNARVWELVGFPFFRWTHKRKHCTFFEFPIHRS